MSARVATALAIAPANACRQTISENAINASTPEPERQTLYDQERSVIEAERLAEMFVPEGEEIP